MKSKELLDWMDKVQDGIATVLGMENISAKFVAVTQSPITITYQLQLLSPTKVQVDRMGNLSSTLEQNLGIAPVRVYPREGTFTVEIPSPMPVTPHADMLAEYSRGSNICVGFDTFAQPVNIALRRFPSILHIAPPRAGKTSSVRSLIYGMLKNNNTVDEKVSVLICAEKMEYWRAFSGLRGVVDVISDFAEMREVLKSLTLQLNIKAKSGERFNPPLVVVVDDLLRVLSQEKDVGKYLGEIASTGGSVGMYLFLITQSAGSNAGTGGIQVEDNIAVRIIYRTTSKTGAARSTGEDAAGIANLTTTQGDALLVVGSSKIRIATGYVEDEDILQLPVANGESAFWRNIQLDLSDDPVPATEPKTTWQIGENSLKETFTEPVLTREIARPLVMQKISPPRELNLGEMRHLRLILNHYNGIGEPLSKNKLMNMLFGGKNSTYQNYLQKALDTISKWEAGDTNVCATSNI